MTEREPSRTALPDLTSCDREPIHIPGAIQPHGVLLAIDPSNRVILQASANAPALLGLSMEQLLGGVLDDCLQWTHPDDPATPQLAHRSWQPVRLPARAEPPTSAWSGMTHRYDALELIELAPRGKHFDDDPVRLAYELSHSLERDPSVARAADRVAKLVRQQLGYDRVMVYRFDPLWNGEVIAEAARPDLQPYLGLNYPASDIPVQARALYLRNRVRAIADIGYVPVSLVPANDPRNNAPTDLSDVSLRAVSPVHIEYLSNMGVSATLVASIILNGRLWGLISCHHYDVLYADHEVRTFADAVARALADRVGAIEEMAKLSMESNLLTVREKLITALNESDHVTPELLGELAPELLETVDADGVAIYAGNNLLRFGQTLEVDELLRVRDHITGSTDPLQQGITGVLHTDALGLRFPALGDLADRAAGIIFMPLQYDTHNAVLWTRHERMRDVRWGGNPHLTKLENIPGARLSPRHSFDAWQETVRGHSRPWLHQHLESARSLRVLLELMERKHYQQNFALMRATLERLQDNIVITSAHAGAWREAPVVFANEAFIESTGHDAEGLMGRPFAQLLKIDPHEAGPIDRLEQLLRAGQPGKVELDLRHGDDSTHRSLIEVEPISDRAGAVTHWLIMQRAGR